MIPFESTWAEGIKGEAHKGSRVKTGDTSMQRGHRGSQGGRMTHTQTINQTRVKYHQYSVTQNSGDKRDSGDEEGSREKS